MPIKRIYLDLDDVLNTFTPHVLWHLGCDIDEDSYHGYPAEVGFDMVRAANKLLGCKRWTAKSLWRQIGQDIWSDVPPSNILDWLLDQCESLVGRDNITIVTAPTDEPECAAGKMEWMQAYLPSWLHRQWFIGSQKHLLAAPTSLLIDDSPSNVVAFRDAGGVAWYMPRPWNYAWPADPQAYLADKLEYVRKGRANAKLDKPFEPLRDVGLIPRLDEKHQFTEVK